MKGLIKIIVQNIVSILFCILQKKEFDSNNQLVDNRQNDKKLD